MQRGHQAVKTEDYEIMKNLTALILFGILLVLSVDGQNPLVTPPTIDVNSPTTSNNIPVVSKELTAADAEAFLDGILLQQLAQDDIAGVTVAVVKDSKILFSKGYGYAVVGNKKSDAFFFNQMQVAMEKISISAVSDDA